MFGLSWFHTIVSCLHLSRWSLLPSKLSLLKIMKMNSRWSRSRSLSRWSDDQDYLDDLFYLASCLLSPCKKLTLASSRAEAGALMIMIMIIPMFIILQMIMLVILRWIKIMLPSFRYWGLGCNLSYYVKKTVLRYYIKIIQIMMVGCTQVFW